MQTCKCLLKTNDYHIGNKTGVTPTEILILKRIHDKEAGGSCIIKPVLTGEAVVEQRNKDGKVLESRPRTNAEEVRRLKSAYPVKARSGAPGTHILDDLYPGVSPALPQTFKEVGIEVAEQAPDIEDMAEHPESQAEGHSGDEGERVVSEATTPPVNPLVKHAGELLAELEVLEAIPAESLTKEQAKRIKALSVLKPAEPVAV